MKTVALMLCLVMAGPAFADDKALEVGKAEVMKKLYDPESARFRDLRSFQKSGVEVVCGWVNAKNKMGGYEGFKPFLYDPNVKQGAIIYGGGRVTDDFYSQLALMKGFEDNCGRP